MKETNTNAATQAAALSAKSGIQSTEVKGADRVPKIKSKRYTCEYDGRMTTDGFEIWRRQDEDGNDVTLWKVPPKIWTPIDKIEKIAKISAGITVRRLAELTARNVTHVSALADEVFALRPKRLRPAKELVLWDRIMTPTEAVKIATTLSKMRRQVRAGSKYERYFEPEAAPPVQQSLFEAAPSVPKAPSETIVASLPEHMAKRFAAFCFVMQVEPEKKIVQLVNAFLSDVSRRLSESN